MRGTMLAFLCILLFADSARGADAPAQASRQVRLLVVMSDDDAPPSVDYKTAADIVSEAGLGLVNVVIADAISDGRHGPFAETFATTMAGFRRNPAFVDALAHSFTYRAGGKDVFALSTTTDFARYVNARGLDKLTGAARAEGFDYALVLYTRFVGLRTHDYYEALGTLVRPDYRVAFRLSRVADDKVLHRGTVASMGYWGRPVAEAVADRDAFVKLWPELCKILADNLTGELNRTDNLHLMAESAGRGADVPAIGALLAAQAKLFKWDLKPVKGWRETGLGTPYARVLEPNDPSRNIMGLRFDVDLLVEELGQKVATLDEYLVIAARRRVEISPEYGPLVKFTDISAPGFETYLSETRTGARQIVLFKKLDERRIEMITAVFLQNFAALYPQNRERIEKMIAWSSVRLR